jgi:hypothetical protein
MTQDVKGNELFNHIPDAGLRTWNRCAVTFNLRDNLGEDAAEAYVENFDERTRATMLQMFAYIKAIGYDEARCAIFGKLRELH